ncbi:MAG: flippase [Chloroflexi bacterium]|nr:flippase [Chloroflexota bacterium]
MIPFKNLLRLFTGDIVAKILFFAAFVYLARILGVEYYGTLEFSLAVLTYFLVLGDGGLELWATRETARGRDPHEMLYRVMPLRLLLASAAFILLLLLLPFFPDYPQLKPMLVLFGLLLFAQAASLKWVFIGQENMGRVASGLVIAQVVFALAIFFLVRSPEDLLWVPILRLLGDTAMVVYFGWLFVRNYGRFQSHFSLRRAKQILRQSLIMGASHGLAFMSYNFDSLLLGFMVSSEAVGWYGAAYKPITAILAVPVTYFIGLFPTLSRTFQKDKEAFGSIIGQSMRLTAVLALPIGVGGTFLASGIILFLFGPEYENSIIPLQILSWSAVLVILRGTFRQSLNAANRQDLDLRCAGTAMAVNVSLNLLLIPRYGIIGAASTTLLAEMIWITLASYYFYRHVAPVTLLPSLKIPLVAAVVMALFLWLLPPFYWMIQGATAVLVYFSVLLLLSEPEVKLWVARLRQLLAHEKQPSA